MTYLQLTVHVCHVILTLHTNETVIYKGCIFRILYLTISTSSQYTSSSSSSSCHAASKDIPDPLSPLFLIVHRLWQVFWATSRILT